MPEKHDRTMAVRERLTRRRRVRQRWHMKERTMIVDRMMERILVEENSKKEV